MRARARRALEDTQRANEVLQSFKQLEREREEQMNEAIQGVQAAQQCIHPNTPSPQMITTSWGLGGNGPHAFFGAVIGATTL